MHSRMWRLLGAGLLLLGALLARPADPNHAAPARQPAPCDTLNGPDGRTFRETGHTVSGVFLDYWEQHGGLAQQGFPISGVLQEVSDLDGQPYQVQYFERAVFECHPENAGTPFVVLLAQLGTFRYGQQYPQGAPGQRPNGEHPYVFPQTGHTLGGEFRTYWEQHGGLAQQGFPLSEEFTEVSPLDGKPYTVQYFERAVFEFHPENQAPYRVLLSQLGTLRYLAHHPAAPAPTPNTTAAQYLGNVRPGGTVNGVPFGGTSAGNLAVGGHYVFWLDADSPWGDPVLRGYDAQAGRQFVVSAAAGYKEGIVSDGRTVVWRETNGPNPPGLSRLHAYNLATGQEWAPFAYTGADGPLGYAVDGDTLYYLQYDTPGGAPHAIYAHNWPTGQTTWFATATPDYWLEAVVAGHGTVAWEETSTLGERRLLQSLGGGPAAPTVLATADHAILISFNIADAALLWEADGRLHIRNLDTGITQAVTWPGGVMLSAAGPLVAWNAADLRDPAHAVVLDTRTGTQQTYALPSSGEYGSFVALAGPGALAYVTGYSSYELYVVPVR